MKNSSPASEIWLWNINMNNKLTLQDMSILKPELHIVMFSAAVL